MSLVEELRQTDRHFNIQTTQTMKKNQIQRERREGREGGKMGKAVEKKKKKKGRPSLLDLQKRTLREQQELQEQQQQQQKKINSNKNKIANTNHSSPQKFTSNSNSSAAGGTPLRRSTRRNPNPSLGSDDEDEEDDELDGNRREKKLKLVLKLQKSSRNSNSNGSDSDENAASNLRKRKINAIGGGSAAGDHDKGEKSISGISPTNYDQGAQLESGPSTSLPDKKLLLFILDRLQKKDSYGVFSEPVDPEELPDYHDIIEHPMDFATVRKKLSNGAYSDLEEFENDIFLICSNAMQYNSPETIYFRQARSIQELAKKNFENLRQDSDDNEPEPKVVRRGRPPTKKKPLGRPPLERARSEVSSDATLANAAENSNWVNHDFRKGSPAAADSSARFYGSRNEFHAGWLAENRFERNDGVSLSRGYQTKQGKKQFIPDESRRNTYTQFLLSSGGREPSVLSTFDAERKQLMTVGLLSEHSYTRSLARFAANLGPVAWKLASSRIERCLPSGMKFGPGWVGENDVSPSKPLLQQSPALPQPMPSQPICVPRSMSFAAETSSVDSKENKSTEKAEGENSSNKSSETNMEMADNTKPSSRFHQNSVIHPGMNGVNGVYGFHLPAQMGKPMEATRSAGFSFQSSQALDTVSRTNSNFVHPVTTPSRNPEDPRSYIPARSSPKADSESSPHQRKPDSVPPDLNIKFQSPGSPNSTRVDLTHPDLALQL